MVDCVVFFHNKVVDKDKLIALLFKGFKNIRQGFGGMLGVVMEQDYRAVFDLTCYPLVYAIRRSRFFPVKAIDARYKSKN